MPLSNDAAAVVEALAEHEEAMSSLYASFAQQFPEVSDLWQALSRDEHAHASALRALVERVRDLDAFVDARRFNLHDIQAGTRKLDELIELIGYSGIGLKDAYRTAVELERSMLESQVFIVAESDSAEVTQVLGTLQAQTEDHRDRLVASLAGQGGR